jgi:glycosyltransferase involved in cell wall biosynthesis
MVTIGIPFYNVRKTLADAVRSIFAQTFQDWELILLDDGSTDGSLELAKKIMDDRVRVVSDGINKGIAARLNQISNLAQGDYIARMDGDDLMHPDRIERQYEYLRDNQTIDVVGASTYSLDHENIVTGGLRVSDDNLSMRSVFRSRALVHPTIMGKKEWFLRFPYNQALKKTEDAELWCRSIARSQIKNMGNYFLYYYRKINLFDYEIYRISSEEMKAVIKRYGPKSVGRFETILCLLSVSVKKNIYWLLTNIGLADWAVGFRFTRLTASEMADAKEGLRRVFAARVPGLDD